VIEPSGRPLFRILGPLEVWNGRDWAQVGAPKWRALLATLLLSPGRPVATGQLIDELWGEHPPAKASNLVSLYVYRLRRLIGDAGGRVLVTRAPGYQIMLSPGGLDAESFARLVAAGRSALAGDDPTRAADLLGAALDLWRGQALADVPATALVAAEADRLEESRVQALELRLEAGLGCGRHAEAAPEVRRLLADHPLREGLWGLLMRALSGAGRQAEALETYARAREVIADELGVDPGPGLQQLYQDILNADAASPAGIAGARAATRAGPAPPTPAQLPADIPDFTGRADQIGELRRLLSPDGQPPGSPGAVPVVLVVGSGGLGKTALAVHVAHLLADRFGGGQLYANLRGATEPVDSGDVLARFLRDLGVDGARVPVEAEERAAQFRTQLAGKQVLIVLDDARDAAQVRPLLPGSASCAVLVAARWAMPELEGSRLLDLDVLPPAEARALFGRVAGEERADAEPEATDKVLVACAGLPLAIRIAGARLAARGGWNVRTLAGRLSDERRRLDELRAGNLAVRASFEVSFASLGGATGRGVDPAHAFRLLGVWTGPFIALSAACALLGQEEQPVADALEVLVDAHLLDSPEPDVYRLHDLLRVYAADRARAQESEQDRQEAVGRLLTWYLHTTEAAARIISPQHSRVPLDPLPGPVRPLELSSLESSLTWCERERAGLSAATRLAAESGLHEAAWKLAAAAMSFFYRSSHWADWVATHQAGLASARRVGDKQGEAWMLNNLGMAYGVQRMAESVTCFEQALVLCREIGDSRGEARAANNVANAYFELRRFDQALAMAERALVVQQRAGRRYGEGIALGIIGGACRELGRHTEAISHLQEALNISREFDDRRFEAASLSDLGDAYLGVNRIAEAVGSYQESLAIRRRIADRRGQATTLRRLAMARQRSGDAQKAAELLTEALHLCEELGDLAEASEVRASLAENGREAG
jgi:DNA-binding SARP family transcriptional activator/tetratricopeptide (TPR) repeat protein